MGVNAQNDTFVRRDTKHNNMRPATAGVRKTVKIKKVGKRCVFRKRRDRSHAVSFCISSFRGMNPIPSYLISAS